MPFLGDMLVPWRVFLPEHDGFCTSSGPYLYLLHVASLDCQDRMKVVNSKIRQDSVWLRRPLKPHPKTQSHGKECQVPSKTFDPFEMHQIK